MIRSIHSVVVLGIFAALGMLVAPAVIGQQTKTFQFDLPSQPLASSLRAIGQLTKTNVLFDSEVVDGVSAPALRAELTVQEAVRRLTAEADLDVQQPAADTITVSKGERGRGEPRASLSQANGIRIAQAEAAAKSGAAEGQQRTEPKEEGEGQKEEEAQLEEVVVTGTHIRGDRSASAPGTAATATLPSRSVTAVRPDS